MDEVKLEKAMKSYERQLAVMRRYQERKRAEQRNGEPARPRGRPRKTPLPPSDPTALAVASALKVI
jgi:hypothetical protein